MGTKYAYGAANMKTSQQTCTLAAFSSKPFISLCVMEGMHRTKASLSRTSSKSYSLYKNIQVIKENLKEYSSLIWHITHSFNAALLVID